MSLLFTAGQTLTADLLNALVPLKNIKSVAQNVPASTVVVDDTELFLDLVAGRTYEVRLRAQASATVAGADIRTVWSNTGTMTFPVVRHCTGPTQDSTDVLVNAGGAPSTSKGVTVASVRTLTTQVFYGCDGVNSSSIQEDFVVSCTAAGRLQFRWAQGTASGTTTVGVNSYIIAVPID